MNIILYVTCEQVRQPVIPASFKHYQTYMVSTLDISQWSEVKFVIFESNTNTKISYLNLIRD